MSSRPTTAPLGPAAVSRGQRDFADWLSPMLVKELRQGMRTRVFVGSFILLQMAMTMNVIIGLLMAADKRDPSFSTAFFWGVVAVPIIFVLPLSGLGTLSNELNANTLELVFLTRLSAWRIVAGKWFAIVAQNVLLVCAVLPYAVLRYFIGGVNVTEELITLAMMLIASTLLCGITVGVSPFQTRLTRALLIGGLVFFSWGILPGFFLVGGAFRVFGPMPMFSWGLGIALAIFCILFLLLMLEIGAGKIAPAAENHAAKKRGFTFALLLLAGLFNLVIANAQMLTVLALLLTIPICIDAVCEQPRWIPSIFRPFARWGLIGRVVGRFAYPGWQTGVPFTIVMLGGFAVLMRQQGALDQPRDYLIYLALCGALLLPVALTRTLFPRTERTLALFIGFQAIAVVITILALVVDENELFRFSLRKWVSILPTASLIMTLGDGLPGGGIELFTVTTAVGTGIAALVLFCIIPVAWRRMQLMENESLQPPTPHAPVA